MVNSALDGLILVEDTDAGLFLAALFEDAVVVIHFALAISSLVAET